MSTKNFHFLFRPKTKFWSQKTPISLHEKKMTSTDYNFLCGRPHSADPLLPIRRRPPYLDHLHVDILNGWPRIRCGTIFCIITVRPNRTQKDKSVLESI